MPKQRRIDDTPVPVRLSAEELEKLECIRHEFRLPTRTAAIRWAVNVVYHTMEQERSKDDHP